MRRCEVAVGTARLASMFSTILSAAPRIGSALTVAAEAFVSRAGAGFAAALAAVAVLRPSPMGAVTAPLPSAGGSVTSGPFG